MFDGILTDQMATEEDLKLALSQREMLLRETHHRVKNNFQMIRGIATQLGAVVTYQSEGGTHVTLRLVGPPRQVRPLLN